MRHLLLAIMVLFGLNLAQAQDAAAPADAPSDAAQELDDSLLEGESVGGDSGIDFQDYSATGFGFKIPIPTAGALETPSDLGWNYEPEVAFVWFGADGDPVTMVELRADVIGTEVSAEQYAEFYDTLVAQWAGQPAQFKVLRSRSEPYHFGDMDWLIIEVEDFSAASTNAGASGEDGSSGSQAAPLTVYYTIFTTYHAETIYTIGFYYLEPVSETVQELAVPMLRGFSITN